MHFVTVIEITATYTTKVFNVYNLHCCITPSIFSGVCCSKASYYLASKSHDVVPFAVMERKHKKKTPR